jgi:hypothetical protein
MTQMRSGQTPPWSSSVPSTSTFGQASSFGGPLVVAKQTSGFLNSLGILVPDQFLNTTELVLNGSEERWPAKSLAITGLVDVWTKWERRGSTDRVYTLTCLYRQACLRRFSTQTIESSIAFPTPVVQEARPTEFGLLVISMHKDIHQAA